MITNDLKCIPWCIIVLGEMRFESHYTQLVHVALLLSLSLGSKPFLM